MKIPYKEPKLFRNGDGNSFAPCLEFCEVSICRSTTAVKGGIEEWHI